MAKLSLSNIVKKYSNSNNTKEDIVVVHNFSLDVADGELIVLVGPSGCGKSTTLRMIAGLEEISSGQLLIDGNIVNDLPPKDRDVAMVFQSYALYPHMSVYDNMAFGLQLRKYPKAEIQERVNVAAKILGLEPYLDRKPKALSGGQRQRVAMGRAIVRKPKIFLFDEPLSNLDAKLRVQMRSEIAKLHRQLKTTSIYVTHDQTEAMTLADRIVIMKDGHIQQIGTPLELYREPANVFVASFIGSPSMNFLKGRFFDNHMKSDSFSIPINNHLVNQLQNGQEILLGIRPESIRISNSKTEQPTNDALKQNNEVSFLGVVETKEVLGSEMFIYFSVDKETIVGRFPPDYHFNNGDNIKLSIDPSGCHIFDAKTEQRLSTH